MLGTPAVADVNPCPRTLLLEAQVGAGCTDMGGNGLPRISRFINKLVDGMMAPLARSLMEAAAPSCLYSSLMSNNEFADDDHTKSRPPDICIDGVQM